MEIDYRAIGKRIKIARIKADLTQEKLAEMVELSTTHMSNIETGTTKISLPTMVRIANSLSITLDDRLCDNVIHASAPIRQDVAELLEDCDEYEIRIIKDIIAATKASLRRDANLRSQHKGAC